MTDQPRVVRIVQLDAPSERIVGPFPPDGSDHEWITANRTDKWISVGSQPLEVPPSAPDDAWWPQTLPQELVDILDERAGKVHSEGGSVRSALAEILNLYDQMKAGCVEHHYLSTACFHGLHQRCVGRCKFCDQRCRCGCGHPGDTYTDYPLVERIAQAVSRLPNQFDRGTCLDIALQVVATMTDIPRSET